MFENDLKKYKVFGAFSFKPSELLKDKCNAPNNQAGVYLIYKIVNGTETLLYIGSSGQKNKDGTLKVRKDGIRDRLINGYHPNRFGHSKRIKRHKAFPQQMQIENIDELKFYWWITYDDNNQDLPTDVELELTNKYSCQFNKKPDWHK